MKIKDFTSGKIKLKTYAVKVKLPGQGYTNIIDTIVTAVNPEMARRLVRVQYNSAHALVGQPREIKVNRR